MGRVEHGAQRGLRSSVSARAGAAAIAALAGHMLR